jgi:magnesium transporter
MLINCVAYENGAKLADIAVEDISDYITGRAASCGWR